MARLSHVKSRPARFVGLVAVAGAAMLIVGLAPAAFGQAPPAPRVAVMPPVPVPAGNPITETKRVLGKILFHDEQLSSDNTTACVTCHVLNRSGVDPRRARHPGLDGVFNTADDAIASPGVINSDAAMNYVRDLVFGINPQITNRTSMPVVNAAYSPLAFWDGRATGEFRDPVTNAVVLFAGGALESQAVGPLMNDTEMAHMNRDWPEVIDKLQSAKPLALATNLTADAQIAINLNPTYPMLFNAAFGDSAITAPRIAMAIATYQRTLIANDTRWDRWNAGDNTALTAQELNGWNAFNASNCQQCHVPPMFTGNNFRNIGLRPSIEDLGRQIVTGNAADRGKMKVPNLRSSSLRSGFMRNGQFTTLQQVLGFYAGPLVPGADNRDPLMNQVNLPGGPGGASAAIIGFLTTGLVDARVQNGTFPFDTMTMAAARPATRPVQTGTATVGGAGAPIVIANMPSLIGSQEFRIGVDRGRASAVATLVASFAAPVNSVLTPQRVAATVTLNASGLGTAHLPIDGGRVSAGQVERFQWRIADPSAVGGVALSRVIEVTYFCPTGGCGSPCIADVASDSLDATRTPNYNVGAEDLDAFIAGFVGDNLLIADIASDSLDQAYNPNGSVGPEDLDAFIAAFIGGC